MTKIVIRLKGGSGSGHFGHSGRPNEVGGSLPGRGKAEFVQDNPSTWRNATEEQRNYAATHPNSITAYFKNLYVDPKKLANIPGKKGEHLRIEQKRVDELAESMRKEGFRVGSSPLICVEQDGTAFVWEGNHRIRAAIQAGLDAIPVDIRYFGGGEMVDGILSPDRVKRIARN